MFSALAVFAFTYLVVSGLRPPFVRLDRTSAALIGAVGMVLVRALSTEQAWAAIHLPTLGLLLGMMLITSFLVEANLFKVLAWQTVARAKGARSLLTLLVVVAGSLSALLVNDTICVMFTPLVLAVAEEAELPPLPFLLALASSSNIGGVVTFTGNPQNMIVGTHAGMSFGHYALRMLPVGVLGLALDALLLGWMFRRELPQKSLPRPKGELPRLDRPLVVQSLFALALVLTGFLLGKSLAGTALFGAALLLIIARRSPRRALGRIDFQLLIFFASLFVVVEGVSRSGALAAATDFLVPRLGHTPSLQLLDFSLATVIGSNLFSNVPFVLLAVNFVPHLLDPARGWMALAMASTLAGNLTVFGSVANLIVLELAGKHGRIGFFRFFRYGAVITAATLALGLGVLLAERALGW